MTDIEHALNSANECAEDMIDEDSGAGAIAVSKEDALFITASPLSELVWSQHKGLSLKYAASSLSEKKASLLGNTEPFSIMISSPQLTNVGESSSTRDFTAGTLNSLQLKQNCENYECNRVTLIGSPRSILGAQPVSSIRIHEQNRGKGDIEPCTYELQTSEEKTGSFGDKEFLNRNGKAILDNKLEHNQSDKKEVGIYLPRNDNSLFDKLRSEADTFDMNHDKTSMPGPDKYGPSAESLLCNVKEPRHGLAVPYASYVGASPDSFKELGRIKNYQTSSLEEVSSYGDYMSAKCGSPIKSASSSKSSECRQANVALDTVEGNNGDRMTHHLNDFQPLCRQCSGDVLSSDFQGRNESQPAHRDKHGVWQASHKGNAGLIWYKSDCNMRSPNMNKGKEHVSSDGEYSMSVSKEREDSNESIESSNSRRLISTGKRALSPDPNISEVSKEFKRQRNGNSCSGSLFRQGSSFKNWISTITGGYTRSDQATPLAFVPHPSPNTGGNLSSLPKSHKESNDSDMSCKNMGFKSFFQALSLPSFKVQNGTYKDLDLQREADASKEHEIAREQLIHGSCHMLCDHVDINSCDVIPKTSERINSGSKEHVSGGSLQLVCDGVSGNLHNRFSMSSERLNHGTCHVEEFPPTTINISSTNSRFLEKPKCNIGQTCNLNDMGSPSHCAKIALGPPSENKGTHIPVSVPNSSLNMAANRRNGFLESLWIRRLHPKVSSPTTNIAQCNQGMELASETLTNNCNVLGPDAVSSDRDQRNSGNCHLLEGQKGSVSDGIQEHSIIPVDPCGSKRISDQNLKSNLNPILPSQRFKKSEHMASVFAKRLDAFRHIRSSIVSNNATCSTTTCIFCGKSGHSIRECSELDETELEDLLKNMNSYDGTIKASCLCIRCFELNHWAISCSHASSERKYTTDNTFVVSYENCNGIKSKLGNPSSSIYDGRSMLWSGGKQERHQVIGERKTPRRGNMSVETELALNSDVSSSMGKVVGPNANNLCLNSVKENVGESILKVKLTSSSSGENESKENQIIYCNFVDTEVTDELVRIFETIRRLRLSRTDIISTSLNSLIHLSCWMYEMIVQFTSNEINEKLVGLVMPIWMKSPVSRFSLEGFFLRLRLGKWEEGSEGTGYHVACINGVNCENCLSVCIGGFAYLVDCHSVSNHDFVEDELKAWWSATLKGGGKPPTVEELNKKLQERVKLGF